jgi:hypothetical protein
VRFRPFADYHYADEARFKKIREQVRQEMEIEFRTMTKKEMI